jgi:hypothetical protein
VRAATATPVASIRITPFEPIAIPASLPGHTD